MKLWRVTLLVVITVIALITLGYDLWKYEVLDLTVVIAVTTVTIALLFLIVQFKRMDRILRYSIQLISGKKSDETDLANLPKLIEENNQKFKLVSGHIKQMGTIKEMPPVHASLLNDEVGQALQAVQVQMKTLKEEEDKQHWITEGLARFGEVLRKKAAMQEYCSQIISTLVRYSNANQGALFLEYANDDDERYLELTASYAYEKRRFVDKKIQLGDGLLGQCMFEKDIIFITDVPKDYVQITSGLGLATPRNIVVVPLIVNEVFYGAFELASFEVMKEHQMEFLKKVSVMIASEIGAIKTLEQTQTLLAESDELSHKLQAQDEEMRVNLEELTATQEKMKRHQSELEKKQAELGSYMSAIDNTIASAEFSIDGNFITANNLFLTLSGYSTSEVRGKSYTELFNYDESLLLMWKNLQLGKFFSGEFRMRDREGKELWMNGTLNPIFDANGKPEKIMLFAQFTTQEKEKLNDLNGMIQALKQTLPMIEFNSDFQCKSANDLFMKLFGLSRLELKNKKLSDFMPDKKFCPEFLKHTNDLLTKNQIQLTTEFEIAGNVRTWSVSISTIRNLSGDVSKVVMLLINETEERVVRLAM